MSAIIDHASKMVFFMALTMPIYAVLRFVFLKMGRKSFNFCRELALLVFVVFSVGLLSQTVLPNIGRNTVGNSVHCTNLIPFKVFVDTYNQVFKQGNLSYFLINFLGNIILFIPFGFFIPWLWKTSGKLTVVIGFGVSLFIELSQLFLKRGTDVDDLILNTAGVALGIVLYRASAKTIKSMTSKSD